MQGANDDKGVKRGAQQSHRYIKNGRVGAVQDILTAGNNSTANIATVVAHCQPSGINKSD